MTPAELLDAFRTEVRDTAVPPLWKDEEIYRYIDDAQKMFCRLQGGIADATSDLTQLSISTGDKFIPISPLILKVRFANLLSDGRDIRILNFEDLQFGRAFMDNDYGFSTSFKLTDETGEVRAIVTGMEANQIRLVKIPEVDDTIGLTVYRIPLTTLKGDSGEEFEIDEQHHWHLLAWVKHLAFLKQDAETYDRDGSERNRQEFLQYCDMARQERERREHKYRTVSYGGL